MGPVAGILALPGSSRIGIIGCAAALLLLLLHSRFQFIAIALSAR